MKNNKLKSSLKVALASTIAVTSAAAIVYVAPEITKTVATERSENKFILDVKNIDEDTLKVSIDNIEDIPKALQFSIKLDGIVPKKMEDGNILIKDLIKSSDSDKIITDYVYNESDNTIDVLITSENSIPKKGSEVEIFELDIEKDSNNSTRNYTILPTENFEYKYVSNTNKEYVKTVEVANKELSINTAPTIERKDNSYIEIKVGEKVQLTNDELRKYIVASDVDNDEITFEVKNVNDEVIKEFTSTIEGIYDLYVTAIDKFGAKSKTLNIQVKVNQIDKNPIITKNGEELQDTTINAGEVFNLMDGVKAVDAIGNPIDVEVRSDKKLNLDPEVDTVYTLTYTATDSIGRTTEKIIKLTVKANKAPIIKGVKDHTLTVGDNFDPRKDVTVEDEDTNIELVVESNVNTNVAGVYKVIYIATDSGNKTTRVQSIVVVNPKMESFNSIPVIDANDVVIQLGEEFDPLNGVTATDNEDGPISNIDVVTNEVNISKAGKYKVTYSATDSKGASSTKTITVIVNDPPKINAEDKTIKLGEKFTPLSGVSASDKEDLTITDIKVLENNVDETKEGTYTVTYSVVDSMGGKSTKTINVTVKKDVVLAESITINNKISSLYIGSSKLLTATIDEKADVRDIEWKTSDENIASIEVIGNDVKIIAKSEGQVTITAMTKDGSNKSDSITIEIMNYEDNVTNFIKDIIDTDIVIPISGTGEANSPLEMEVKNITVEKFDDFLSKLKDFNPILEKKYEDGDFIVYRIKIKDKSIISKITRLFGARTNSEGYIELKVSNNLDSKEDIINKLDDILATVENPGDTNTPGGDNSGDTNTPGGDNSGDTNTPGGDNSGDANTPGGDNSEDTNSPDKDNSEGKNNSTKLPITGQESILGYLSLAAIAIGGVLYKKKK